MARFTVQTRNGDQMEVTGRDGATLLKAMRKAGVEEVVAQCGGGCACATCHVYVTPPEGVVLPQVGPGEARMLATSRYRTLASRLSCQLKLEPGLERMLVVIAPDDGGDF
ncbi:2Fe-2S iron-sulfur cluster-binding protein [Xanthobacter oligotrophicus]|uniref:2Fe-2S iron-sulfur cluster-binding protein n=1 Tax=Xanthobacter oligotrophicus TaxID=2607286 RepID=A0ABW6ZTA2_9HYPH|nr:2Fe-2S iron-sulfur cluster-binding protein [Xanthobacter oligotrophicus]MCG5236148.1 (2Fe-2S)-binding protein [Xanthobacter oligotrophicus]